MNEQELRDALHGAVPPAPQIEWTPRPRHPAIVPVLAALLVLAIAVPLGIFLQRGDEPGPVHEPRPSPSPGDFACPAEGAAVRPGSLRGQVLAARLCHGGEGFSRAFPEPRDALTAGAAELAAWLRDQPVVPPDAMCTMDLGRSYRIVFQYADGRLVPAEGGLYGCQKVKVGDVERAGAFDLLDRYVAAHREQRRAAPAPTSPDDPEPPPCPAPGDPPAASVVAVPQELTAARLCIRGTGRSVRDVRLSATQLETILASFHREDDVMYKCGATIPDFTLVGVTGRGESVALEHRSCFQLASLGLGEVWRPGNKGIRVLADLLGAQSYFEPAG